MPRTFLMPHQYQSLCETMILSNFFRADAVLAFFFSLLYYKKRSRETGGLSDDI